MVPGRKIYQLPVPQAGNPEVLDQLKRKIRLVRARQVWNRHIRQQKTAAREAVSHSSLRPRKPEGQVVPDGAPAPGKSEIEVSTVQLAKPPQKFRPVQREGVVFFPDRNIHEPRHRYGNQLLNEALIQQQTLNASLAN